MLMFEECARQHEGDKKKVAPSPTGNRTPVSRVTGGDTYHYTIEDWMVVWSVFVEQNRERSFLDIALRQGRKRPSPNGE